MNIGAKDKIFEEMEKNDNVDTWGCDSSDWTQYIRIND